MAFTDVFGGELIFPSQLSYLKITTAVDITLQWPTEQQITGDNVVADFLDIDATAASINIRMPSASVTSTGNKATISNVGFNDFDVLDNTGGPIQTIEPGDVWVIVLTDNTTQAGIWSTFQLGATVSVASAAALAGAGIKAIGVLLNQKIDSDVEALSPITVVNGDRAKCLIWVGGAGQADLPDPGAVGDDWFFMIRNSGTGTLTIMPTSGQVDSSANITIEPGGSTFLFTDNTDFFTIGLTQSSTIGFDYVSIPVPGSGDFVLSGANLDRISYRFTGALTGNRRIVVPNTTQQYWCDNQTTGAFALTISTPAQASPPELEQGETAIFYSNAVDIINAVNATSISLPLSVVQGGTGANNPTDARNNLEAAHDELDMIAGDGLIGGGLLQADVTFQVGAGIGVGVNTDDVFLDFTTVSAEVPAAGDFVAFQDIDDSDITKKVAISGLLGEVQQLFDSASNVRVSAELLGVAQLRSDGNVDAEVRLLEYAHSDGTPVALIGQPSASIELIIANLMDGGLVTISAENAVGVTNLLVRGDPDGITELFAAGICRFEAQSLGKIAVRSDGNTDAEDRQLVFDHQDTSDRGRIGYIGDDILLYKNEIHGGNVKIQAEDIGGVVRDILEGDPDTDVKLFHAGTEVLRTLAVASGGLEIDNQATGAGFERVLTTADLGGVLFRGCKAWSSVGIFLPNDPAPTFPVNNNEVALALNSESFDTDNIHNNAVNNTRLTVPAGVTRIILRGGANVTPVLGGLTHLRMRKNGVSGLSLDTGMAGFVPHRTTPAGGTGSSKGLYSFQSGVIQVVATDFFEMYGLGQNNVTSLVQNTIWFEMEIIQ
jgi:hypothetical protein